MVWRTASKRISDLLDWRGIATIIPSYLAAYADNQMAQLVGGAVAGASGGAILYSHGQLQLAEEFPGMLYKPEATAIDMETGALIF